jgi:biopolymer transport protein ExbD
MRRKRRQPLTADLTPLIDIVFLLLIFFLVSSVFKKEELALLLNLPETENYQETVQKQELSLELTGDELALNGKQVSFDELDVTLVQVKNKKTPVVVRIDEQVMYLRITELFDVLQKHELTNLMLISKNREGKIQ